jgi:hypothetical protein
MVIVLKSLSSTDFARFSQQALRPQSCVWRSANCGTLLVKHFLLAASPHGRRDCTVFRHPHVDALQPTANIEIKLLYL